MATEVTTAPAPTAVSVADTTVISGGMDREAITPAQFMAELEAAGAVPGPNAAAGEGPEASAAEAAAAKPAEVAKVDDNVNGDKVDGEKPAAEVEAKVDDKPPEPKADDSAEVKAARKIYQAAARKEAAALRTAQENKRLQGTIDQLTKLRAEDPLALLQALGFGKGAESDPVKDLLKGIVSKGEKPTPTADERVEALEKRLAEEKATNDARAQAENVRVYQLQVAEQVKAAGDRFDLVNAFEAHDQVWEVMSEYFGKHGVAPDPLVAAQQVENYLAAKVGKSTKFKAPGPAAQAAKPGTASTGSKPASNATGKSETLTNTGSGTLEADDLPMDDHDARAKAAAKALGLAFIRN